MATSPFTVLDSVNVSGRSDTNWSSAIRTELTRTDVLHSNLFVTRISPPEVLNTLYPRLADNITLLSYRTDSASIPGIQFSTSSIRRYGVGMEERKPMNATVIDQQFSFIGDRDGDVHRFFYAWMNCIIATDEWVPSLSKNQNRVDSDLSPGKVRFKNEYATTIVTSVYDKVSDTVIQIKYHNAFPVFLGDVNLSWGDNNNFVRFPVTFTYTHWTSEKFNKGQLTDGIQRTTTDDPFSVVRNIYKLGTALALMSATRRPQNLGDVINVTNNAKVVLNGYGKQIFTGVKSTPY